jgi:hypothetical protein
VDAPNRHDMSHAWNRRNHLSRERYQDRANEARRQLKEVDRDTRAELDQYGPADAEQLAAARRRLVAAQRLTDEARSRASVFINRVEEFPLTAVPPVGSPIRASHYLAAIEQANLRDIDRQVAELIESRLLTFVWIIADRIAAHQPHQYNLRSSH